MDSARYISSPSKEEIEEVKAFIEVSREGYDYDDPFDLAVDCAYGLEIFDWDQQQIDGDPFCIPAWIVTLCGGDSEEDS